MLFLFFIIFLLLTFVFIYDKFFLVKTIVQHIKEKKMDKLIKLIDNGNFKNFTEVEIFIYLKEIKHTKWRLRHDLTEILKRKKRDAQASLENSQKAKKELCFVLEKTLKEELFARKICSEKTYLEWFSYWENWDESQTIKKLKTLFQKIEKDEDVTGLLPEIKTF